MKKKKEKIKVTYTQDPNISEEEAQRCLDKAFDILFESIYKNYWLKRKDKNSLSDKSF